MAKPRILSLEEAKGIKEGWFEFIAPATGKGFIRHCEVKPFDNDGYCAMFKRFSTYGDFGLYCAWANYNGEGSQRWRVWSDNPEDCERRWQ